MMMPDREKVIGEFERWCDEMADECPVICLHALALLKEQPEIVRCKDCKHYKWLIESCDHVAGSVAPDWFCADAERR